MYRPHNIDSGLDSGFDEDEIKVKIIENYLTQKKMNWKQLKEFCNSLDEEQLERKVILWREVEAISAIDAMKLQEDHYIGEDEEACYPESEAKEPLDNLKKMYQKGDPILWEDF